MSVTGTAAAGGALWGTLIGLLFLNPLADLVVTAGTEVKPGAVEAVGFLVAADGPVPAGLGADREALAACGFDGRVGQCLVVPGWACRSGRC